MGASASFKELSQVIGQYESDGGRIQHVEAEMPDRDSETGLTVTLDVPISLCPGEESGVAASPQAATMTDDGGIRVEFSRSMLPGLDEYVPEDASIVRDDAHVTNDGTIVATFTLTFKSENRESDAATGHSVDSRSRSAPLSTASGGDGTKSSEVSTTTGAHGEAIDDADSISELEDTQGANEESTSDQTEIEEELDDARTEDLPPYEDDEYLQCLYDSFDTFAQMAEHIEMDVSSETVRRYMTEAGIHEPTSYETTGEAEADDCTADDGETAENAGGTVDEPHEQMTVEQCADAQSSSESESEWDSAPKEEDDPIKGVSNTQLAADGIGLPDGLTIEELADAVESSMTLYDVQRQLDLGRERTQELLKQLNLVDLVVQRISHNPDERVTRKEIARRIHSSTIED
jgi:hypothetical protein